MNKFYSTLLAVLLLCGAGQLQAQCTDYTLDWDVHEYFARDNGTIRTYVSLAQSQTQRFAFGANKLTIGHNYSTDNNIKGDVTTHTAETGSLASGADIQFIGDGTVTFTFDSPVTNLRFSIYDVDRSQRIQFGATNGATPVIINMTKVGGTTLTLVNNGMTNARVTTTSTTVNNENATVNVTIPGPVTNVTIQTTNTNTCSSSCGGGGTEDASYFISDITACSNGSFLNNYYNVSQPYNGMPGYVMLVVGNKFYYYDPATGVAKFIFQDNTHTNMNSLAYDPYNRLIYYTYSLSGGGGGVNANEKALRRYDMNMDTFGVVLNNVNDLGIPTFGQGVESGAAAFYNGNLYWGIEGNNSSAIESIIYRIELNGSNFPIGFSQVYAQRTRDGSGNRDHDWADFALNDGILYDFDGGAVASPGLNADFHQLNLITGAYTRYTPVSGVIPKQVSVDWQGNVYNVGTDYGFPDGQVALYNGTTNQGTPVTITHNGVNLTGSYGDGAEAFRPLLDYGDAPASYDPDPMAPAVNERDTALRIGTNIDIEWLTRGQSVAANLDNYDDGVATVTIFSNLYSTYQVQVSVYNNTGSDASLIGWLDWNGNGVFDAGEASAIETIGTAAGDQLVYLSWSGISSTLNTGDITYLRIRLTRDINNISAADATGWFPDGETEDYQVSVQNIVLPVNLLSFDAKVVNNSQVQLIWKAITDDAFDGFEIQRSQDGNTWNNVGFVSAAAANTTSNYSFTDQQPFKGKSHYRLKLLEKSGAARNSEIRQVNLKIDGIRLTVSPNPASSKVLLTINNSRAGENAHINIMDASGRTIHRQQYLLRDRDTTLEIPLSSVWQAGTYLVIVSTESGIQSQKLLIRR